VVPSVSKDFSAFIYRVKHSKKNTDTNNSLHRHWYMYNCKQIRGLGVACWPLVPKFVGSNPAEAIGILEAKKSSAHLPSEGK